MDDLGGEFLTRARSMTEPILPQIQRVLAADEAHNGTDESSKRGCDNSNPKSDYNRGKLKLQKARRLSSGGLMRGQKKRRVKYPLQRSSTAPEQAHHSMGNEDKRNATIKPQDKAEDKLSQLYDQTSPSAAVDKTVESKELECDLNRETDTNERKVVNMDGSTSSAKSIVTTRSEPFRLDKLGSASEIERSYQDSKINATIRCGDQETTESNSEVCLSDENTRAGDAKTEFVSKVLQTEEVGEGELKVGTTDMVTECDIVDGEVHQDDLLNFALFESSRRRWSLPTSLRSFEMSQKCIRTTAETPSAFETHGYLSRKADAQTTLQRSISLPNCFVSEKIDDLQCRLAATKVTGDLQCCDEQIHRLPKPEKTDFAISVSEQKCVRPSALIHLEVLPNESTSQRKNENDLRRSKSALSSVGNIPTGARTTQEKLSVDLPTDASCEKNFCEEGRDTGETEEDESRRKFCRSKSKSLPALFNCPAGSLNEAVEVEYADDLHNFPDRQANANIPPNANKQWKRRSPSLPSVLTGNTENAARTTFTKFREFSPAAGSSGTNLTETAPKDEKPLPPEGHVKTLEVHVNEITEKRMGTLEAPHSPNRATEIREQCIRAPDVLQSNHAAEITDECVRSPETVQPNHATEITESQPNKMESQPNHANEATELQPNNATEITESQPNHVTELTESQPNHATKVTETQPNHATEITKSQPNHATEITKSQPNHATEITKSQRNHATEITEIQPNHATEVTEECVRSPEIARPNLASEITEQSTRASHEIVQPNDTTEPAKHLESTSDSSTIIIKYNKAVRRTRSTSVPHTCIMERIVEVSNEQELREAEYIAPETRNSQRGGGDIKTNRVWKLGLLGRSRSIDYSDLCQVDNTHKVGHAQATCTEDPEEQLMLGAEDIELTLTDVFEQDTTIGESNNEEGQNETAPVEDFNHRISKFDDILSNVVSSFLEPDYALSSSSLHRAVAKGDLECAKLLVESGSDVNADDEHGLPALHVAVVSENYEMAEYLIEAGADLQLYTETMIHEYTVLKQQVYFNLNV